MFNPNVTNESNLQSIAAVNSNSKDIAEEITLITKAFEQHQGKMLAGTGGLELLESENKKRFFGVHKDQQKNLDFKEVRSHILHELGLPSETKIVQVIGDSGRFSSLGTAVGRQFLAKHLSEQDLILWGYTGKAVDANGTCEVNQLVTNWLESDTRRFSHALANVVDFHTPLAIKDWKCSVSANNHNFYLVHGRAEFGCDVDSSDPITNAAICLEGGIQSFRQIVNFLLTGAAVIGIYNMRGENNPDTYHTGLAQYLTYFSAGEFIDLLQKEIELRGAMTADEVEQFKDAYLQPRHLYNPSRNDASTKQKLWDKAWETFMEQKLWLKLGLCDFKNVGRTIDQYITANAIPSRDPQRHIVITGGPGVGKTSAKEYFRTLGVAVVDEAATDVIVREQDAGISEPWVKKGFREKIIALQEERQLEATAKKTNLVVFDRSPIDTFTYCLHIGKDEPTGELIRAVQKVVDAGYYDEKVFLLENLGFCNQNEVRCEDQDESLIIQMRLQESYKKLGFTVVQVPPVSIEERVERILATLQYRI